FRSGTGAYDPHPGRRRSWPAAHHGSGQAAWRHLASRKPAWHRHHRYGHSAGPERRARRKSRMTVQLQRPPEKSEEEKPPIRERRGLPAASPIRLAHIVSVSGSHAVAVLDRQDLIANAARVQIGALIKIATPGSMVMGVISAISAPMPAAEGEPQPTGLIEI